MSRKSFNLAGALSAAFIATPVLAADKVQSQSRLGSLQEVAQELFKVLLVFLPIIATIYLAVSGYRYIVAQGNPEMVEKAKKSLTYAVFGAGLAYAAVLVILFVARVFNFHTGLL